MAVFNRVLPDSLDSSSCLGRHAELARILDSLGDLRATMLKWSVLCLVAPPDRESFNANQGSKSTFDYAKEGDLYFSQKCFTSDRVGAVRNIHPKSKKKSSEPLCYFHWKFGMKAIR